MFNCSLHVPEMVISFWIYERLQTLTPSPLERCTLEGLNHFDKTGQIDLTDPGWEMLT